MEPETHYATSGGLHIAYQVMGEGPGLVMVPGLTSHLEIQWRDPGYRRFVRSLSSAAKCRRPVVLGFSDGGRRPSRWRPRIASRSGR